MSDDSEQTARRILALLDEVAGLASLANLAETVAGWRQRLVCVLAEFGDGLAMVKLISAFNDRLTVSILKLVAQRHRLPQVAWCWVAFGSEGRYEQTWLTDQDNGLVFNAADDREAQALRELFLPFAEEANARLADAGFERCPGGIMAGNPECCLSFDEWRWRFGEWVRRPDPRALLNAAIFFDLRPLYGETALVGSLQAQLLAATRETPAFEHLMAANALQVDIPLNFIGEVSAEDGAVDLKKYGSRVFVDAARILALSHGSTAVGTTDRLREAGPPAGMSAPEISAAISAFSHLLRLRLGAQLGLPPADARGLRLDRLDEMDRAILREALKQAKRLQLRLKLNYSLS